MAIVQGNLFHLLLNNGILSVLIRIASMYSFELPHSNEYTQHTIS